MRVRITITCEECGGVIDEFASDTSYGGLTDGHVHEEEAIEELPPCERDDDKE